MAPSDPVIRTEGASPEGSSDVASRRKQLQGFIGELLDFFIRTERFDTALEQSLAKLIGAFREAMRQQPFQPFLKTLVVHIRLLRCTPIVFPHLLYAPPVFDLQIQLRH